MYTHIQCIWSVIILCIFVTSHAFVLDDTCTDRCDSSLDSSKSCQCNSQCDRFHDCCTDYQSVCNGGGASGACKSLTQTAQAMWDKDYWSKYSLNLQGHVADGTHTDHASSKLFSSVDTTMFQRDTYRTFFALLDNFDHDKGDAEHVTSSELQEEKAFMDAILATSVMQELQSYLTCQHKVSSTATFRALLQTLWFDHYARSSGGSARDTSGFEHLMAGEYKSSSEVNGFHSWLAFYKYEQDNSLNYLGWVRSKTISSRVGVLGAAFAWQGHLKTMGSFFVGVSPEFDIAIYTLCFVLHPGNVCHFSIDGTALGIQSYSQHGHIATAYVQT